MESIESKTPMTLGDMRSMLAETMREVRYGHMNPQQGIAVAKVAAQIASLIKVEMEAWQYLDEAGAEVKREMGKLPVHREPRHRALAG